MRGATLSHPHSCAVSVFQSTHPMRGATVAERDVRLFVNISIHAPHAGCDIYIQKICLCKINFNPRTPCGVRLHSERNMLRSQIFQSTHPMRGATADIFHPCFNGSISIHAPHAGCDISREGRRFRLSISIHAPHAGCDRRYPLSVRSILHFNPRTPCGVRLVAN